MISPPIPFSTDQSGGPCSLQRTLADRGEKPPNQAMILEKSRRFENGKDRGYV